MFKVILFKHLFSFNLVRNLVITMDAFKLNTFKEVTVKTVEDNLKRNKSNQFNDFKIFKKINLNKFY